MKCSALFFLSGLLRLAANSGTDTCPGEVTNPDDEDASLLARRSVVPTTLRVAEKNGTGSTDASMAITFCDQGVGMCLSSKDYVHDSTYHHGRGSDCEDLCTAKTSCGGYAVSVFGNCILWSGFGFLTGGGGSWGGAHCFLKSHDPACGRTTCQFVPTAESGVKQPPHCNHDDFNPVCSATSVGKVFHANTWEVGGGDAQGLSPCGGDGWQHEQEKVYTTKYTCQCEAFLPYGSKTQIAATEGVVLGRDAVVKYGSVVFNHSWRGYGASVLFRLSCTAAAAVTFKAEIFEPQHQQHSRVHGFLTMNNGSSTANMNGRWTMVARDGWIVGPNSSWNWSSTSPSLDARQGFNYLNFQTDYHGLKLRGLKIDAGSGQCAFTSMEGRKDCDGSLGETDSLYSYCSDRNCMNDASRGSCKTWPVYMLDMCAASCAPPFHVASGNCTVVGDCVQSPNYPSSYGNNEECRITVGDWSEKHIHVVDFQVENNFDHLQVNGVWFSGSTGPADIRPTEDILWSSDYIVGKSGWKLCGADVMLFSVASGNCTVNGACVQSPNRPEQPPPYNRDGGCTINVVGNWSGRWITARNFYTKWADKLTVNGKEYSGSCFGADHVVPTTDIQWSPIQKFASEESWFNWELCGTLKPLTPEPS